MNKKDILSVFDNTTQKIVSLLNDFKIYLDGELPEDETRPPVEPPVEPPVDPVEPPTRPPRPPVEPPVEPPTDSWPEVSDVETTIVNFDKVKHEIVVEAPTSWQIENNEYRFAVKRTRLDGLLYILFFEQFAGFNATRVTFALSNAFKNKGAYLFDSLDVVMVANYDNNVLYSIKSSDQPGFDAIQVRGTLARRACFGVDSAELETYEHISPITKYNEVAPWINDMTLKGLTESGNSWNSKRIGIYNINDPGVKGSSSLNGSHGGWKVGPYHMGPLGWQRCSRDGYKWAEIDMFGTLDRSPIAIFDELTLSPLNPHVPYWPGRASSTISGFEPEIRNECPYLADLERYEAHSYSHLHREIAAAAMLAPRDVFARWLLVEVYWHDISLWLDGAESNNNLLKNIHQLLRELPPNQGWTEGGRGFAHSVKAFLFAEPYFSPESRDDLESNYDPSILDSDRSNWRDRLIELILHVVRSNGIIHSKSHDPNYPDISNSARAREVDLMYPNLELLNLENIATACQTTMASIDGVSVSASFDSSNDLWHSGDHSKPNYYPWYDLIRHDLTTLDLSQPLYTSPNEQQISLVHPKHFL